MHKYLKLLSRENLVMFYYLIFVNIVKNSTPMVKDLYKYVFKKYAPFWKDIGSLLDLSTARLDIIECNYRKVVDQCRAMFNAWLERDPYATWKKLIEVLDKVDHTHGKVYIHMHVYVCMYVYACVSCIKYLYLVC